MVEQQVEVEILAADFDVILATNEGKALAQFEKEIAEVPADFSQRGGTLELVHLWVTLPNVLRDVAPKYQPVLDQDIPVIDLPDNAGTLRIIAGAYRDRRGPAHTFTPMNVWDLRLRAGHRTSLTLKQGNTGLVLVLRGTIKVNGQQAATVADTVLLDRQGDELTIDAASDAAMLLLSGEPIKHPA